MLLEKNKKLDLVIQMLVDNNQIVKGYPEELTAQIVVRAITPNLTNQRLIMFVIFAVGLASIGGKMIARRPFVGGSTYITERHRWSTFTKKGLSFKASMQWRRWIMCRAI